MEVKTPGVMAAEAAQAAGAQEAFLKQQMGVLEVMKDTLLTKLGGPTGKASTIKIAPTVDWPTLQESDSDVKEFSSSLRIQRSWLTMEKGCSGEKCYRSFLIDCKEVGLSMRNSS